MDLILYNPISRNGKNEKIVKKLEKKLIKEGRKVEIFSLLDITDVNEYMVNRNKDDRVIIVGGDGTINRIANVIYDMKISQDIFMYKAGTGNDFMRSIKTKGKLVPIKEYLFNLPKVSVNGKESRFLNGCGVGIDGLVCYKVNTSKKKNKFNYFKNVLSAFKESKAVNATINIDGKVLNENKVWLSSIMNAPYLGGGMKIAPKANRKDKNLQVVVVKKVPKFLIIFILPTIYLGWHRMFKRWVKTYVGYHVDVEFDHDVYMQIDGETEYPVRKITVTGLQE